MCDGVWHCPDGEDEQACGEHSINTTIHYKYDVVLRDDHSVNIPLHYMNEE